jgi:CheY-like chemotaxis protein
MTTEATQRLILYVDDEEQALKYFEKIFSRHFQILTASSTDQAMQILATRASEIGVLMTDQRMPKRLGVDLLADIRKKYPHIVRLLTTAYAELDNAIEAVNEGEIFRYITKPWNIQELRVTLRQALDHCQSPHTQDQVISPYAILAAGLSGRFRGCKQAVAKMIAHWPQPKSASGDTSRFIALADIMNHASSAMDDDLSLVHLEERIRQAPEFSGQIESEDRTGAIRFQGNARLLQAAVEALARIRCRSGVDEQATVKLQSEIRNKIHGITITWQIIPAESNTNATTVCWSPDLLLVYLFTTHHGGQVSATPPCIELWLPLSPRDVDVPRAMDNWLADVL